MSASDQEVAKRRVQDVVRRRARTRAFAEAEDVITAVLPWGCRRCGPG